MGIFSNKPDAQTWNRVLAGDVTAYQQVVETHQSSVSAVAYAIVGDFPVSQDIAQETFWVAWTERNSLRDVGRLGGWLCGIARNLARQWYKQQKRRSRGTQVPLSREPAAAAVDPVQQAIAEEEQTVVWSALQQIPENYREVLTLYYRQGQSLSDVALTLEISEEAARQRLSRGRNMLRGRVAQLIEGVLDRSKPDRAFTTRVIAGLTGAGVAAKAGTAAASSLGSTGAASGSLAAAAAKGVLASGATTGLLGGALGAIGGLAGGFLGTWIPAQLAPTETERQLLLQQGRKTMGLAIVFTVAVLALTLAYVYFRFHPLLYAGVLVAISAAFVIPVVVQSIRLNRLVSELREKVSPEKDPNRSSLAKRGNKIGLGVVRRGRSWRSDLELFGYPLIDIQFNDVVFGGQPHGKQVRKKAVGWIALGDHATGILFAAGGIAKGFVALGGIAIGAISLGGLSVGVLAMGGLATGLLALGGGAIGWDAAGGGAIGWHSATGGLAVAWHAAMGGLAVASEYAVGGSAFAAEANTPLAEAVVERDTAKAVVEWFIEHQMIMIGVIVALSTFPVLASRWIYQVVDRQDENESG